MARGKRKPWPTITLRQKKAALTEMPFRKRFSKTFLPRKKVIRITSIPNSAISNSLEPNTLLSRPMYTPKMWPTAKKAINNSQ